RYAEILLNAAEAAAELKLAGESAPAGDDFIQIAYEAVRDIRERAGADPLTSAAELENEAGLKIIRRERQKELGYENKNLWDIRRWRTQHADLLNGFTQSDGAYYRALYPFYSSKANKYFFDARFQEDHKRFRLTEQEYYFAIPGDQVSKSPVIDQQPGR
ncbi:MAG: RagB/SusD family nutrient uptake outer membrane protein, partial [Tannerella sp.]|nr:RagB/SusD family nutrient uptake outer membrane protein [Tannerella sp.]